MEITICALCASSKTISLFSGKDRELKRPEEFQVVKCLECGLIYTNPRPTKEEMIQYYPMECCSYYSLVGNPSGTFLESIKNTVRWMVLRQHYNYFASRISRIEKSLTPSLKVLTRPLKCFYSEVPFFKAGGKLLEVGCGNGRYLQQMRELGWDTFGVEINAQAVKAVKENLGLNVFPGELAEAKFPTEFFDVVVLLHVLEHLFDPCDTLREIHRILRDEGILILTVPDVTSLGVKILGDRWYGWKLPRHLYHFSPVTLRRMLDKTGFTVLRVEYQPSINNIIGSLRYVFEDHDNVVSKFLLRFIWDNRALRWSLAPLAYILRALKQSGRITVHAKKCSG